MDNYEKGDHLVMEQIKNQLHHSEKVIKEKDEYLDLLTQDLIEQLETLGGFFQIMYHHSGSLTKVEIEEFASRMDISVKNMLLLVGNLKEWAALQKGEIEIKPEKIKLKDAVLENIDFFEHVANRKNITLISLVDPSDYVMADRDKLNYILRNLISNGIKFTTIGGNVDISASRTGKMTEIIISDDGVGIPDKVIKKIFETETPISTKGTAFERGNGYGLLSVKKLVEMNKGRLYIESIVYEGTKVILTLPSAD